jgi:2'-5' RNA ligase
MDFALCLRFDRDTTEAVERVWRSLAEAGVSSDMLELGYPPHLTLIVASDEADVANLARSLPRFAGHVPEQIELGGPRAFPNSDVAYLTCGSNLKELQRQVAALVPSDIVHEHYRSDIWTPHVTLQTRGDATRAVAIAAEHWQPLEAVPVALDLVSFPPVAVHTSVPIR